VTRTLQPDRPGEVLVLEFLEPMNVTQHRLALAIGVPPRRIKQRDLVADQAIQQVGTSRSDSSRSTYMPF
jgi:plasmid maintenance system antidote protein VapI